MSKSVIYWSSALVSDQDNELRAKHNNLRTRVVIHQNTLQPGTRIKRDQPAGRTLGHKYLSCTCQIEIRIFLSEFFESAAGKHHRVISQYSFNLNTLL